ncbi:MAG: C39 family peptidase [Deltaproteobacteria bacterium]|nr:C39 family peptidase [Deltaproteobacteria bacterium]
MPDPRDVVAACDADLRAERAQAARTRLDELPSLATLEEPVRLAATYARLRADAALDEPLDRVILDSRAALATTDLPRWRAIFLREIATHLAFKRCPLLGQKEAEAAIAADPTSTIGPDALAWVHLTFDRRDEALAVYERALDLDEPWRAQLGVARIAYVLGDFGRALRTLDEMPAVEPVKVPALRVRISTAQVQQDHEQLLGLLDELLRHTQGGYRMRHDLLVRASTLSALGRMDEAVEQYRAVWRENETDAHGRFAREVLNNLERNTEGRRVSLSAFPTVSQKRNYCGPAVLELVLRHLGVDADQDSIAESVKLPSGSPTVRMTGYLESQGLATRRFEATAPRLTACLAQGLPVVVEEEYSTTTHVAVVTGVDERLGLIVVQDPMTHAPSERLIQMQTTLGALFRQSAIVAYRATDTAVGAALDEADVLDAEHIRMVDSCDADDVRDNPEEVVRRAGKALRREPDYPLAWLRGTRAMLALARRHPSRANLDRFLAQLRRARTKYPDLEWTHQVHGDYLMWEGRWHEAIIEIEDALRYDPEDANNAQFVAECLQMLHEVDAATAAFWKALTLDPSHVRATENFAAHALDHGNIQLAEHLSACALDMAADNPFNHITAARIAERLGRVVEATEHARRAVEVDPDWNDARLHLATLLRRRPDGRAEALDIFRQLATKHELWFSPRLSAADMLREQGDVDEAVALLTAGIERATDEPTDLVRLLVEILRDDGRVDEALEVGRRAAEDRRTLAMQAIRLEALRREERQDEGVALARTLHADHPGSAATCAELGSWLLDTDERVEGEKLLRQALDLAPTYSWARHELFSHLMLDREVEALELTMRADPDDDAWLLLDRAQAQIALARFDDATATVRRAVTLGENLGTAHHVERARALLGSHVAADALRFVQDAAKAERWERLTRLALELALERTDDALATAELLGGDDAAIEMLCRATERDERHRDALERALRAAIASAETTFQSRRYDEAVLAGSLAVRGERSALEAFLPRCKRATHAVYVLRSLDDVRHAELVVELRERVSAIEESSITAALERANLASMRGDHRGSIELLRAAAARFPKHHTFHEYLGAELLRLGDDEAHAWVDRTMSLTTRCEYSHELAAVSHLLRGDRDSAARHARHAQSVATAYGTPVWARPHLDAVLAVLSSDAPRLGRAATRPTLHLDPRSPLWPSLGDRIDGPNLSESRRS